MKWADVQCPDDDGETHDKRDSGELYVFRFLRVKPPAVVAVVSAKSVDDQLAKRGVLVDEEATEETGGYIEQLFAHFFRRKR